MVLVNYIRKALSLEEYKQSDQTNQINNVWTFEKCLSFCYLFNYATPERGIVPHNARWEIGNCLWQQIILWTSAIKFTMSNDKKQMDLGVRLFW